jgi:hypothetical protein
LQQVQDSFESSVEAFDIFVSRRIRATARLEGGTVKRDVDVRKVGPAQDMKHFQRSLT